MVPSRRRSGGYCHPLSRPDRTTDVPFLSGRPVSTDDRRTAESPRLVDAADVYRDRRRRQVGVGRRSVVVGRDDGHWRRRSGARIALGDRRRSSLGSSICSHGVRTGAAVVLGVLLALAIGGRSSSTASPSPCSSPCRGISELVLRLPPAAAQRLPISILVVLGAVARATGARVGIVSSTRSSALPSASACRSCSRRHDSWTLDKHWIASPTASPASSSRWGRGCSRRGRPSRPKTGVVERGSPRGRLVDQAAEAVGNGRKPPAGTSEIGDISMSSDASRKSCPGSNGRRSASRSSHEDSMTMLASPGRTTGQCRRWARS